MKTEEISAEVTTKITAYVYANYKDYKDKKLYIVECDNCFTINNHINGSPLILGKKLFV